MTVQEFNNLYSNIEQRFNKELDEIKLNPKKFIDIKMYDWAFSKHSIDSEEIYNYNDSLDLIYMINEFLDECKSYEDELGFCIELIDLETEYETSLIDGGHYQCKWKKMIDSVPEHIIKNSFISEVKNLLLPDDYKGFIRTPECSILTLFKNGTIDWKTLQMITYKDCKI